MTGLQKTPGEHNFSKKVKLWSALASIPLQNVWKPVSSTTLKGCKSRATILASNMSSSFFLRESCSYGFRPVTASIIVGWLLVGALDEDFALLAASTLSFSSCVSSRAKGWLFDKCFFRVVVLPRWTYVLLQMLQVAFFPTLAFCHQSPYHTFPLPWWFSRCQHRSHRVMSDYTCKDNVISAFVRCLI